MPDAVTTVLIGAYVLLLLWVGSHFVHRQDDPEGFYLGGRELGPLAVAGTMYPTFLGTGLLFTLAAFGYQYGVGALLLPGAAAVGFALFAWAAPRIKALSDAEGAITLPALMADHWTARTRSVAALITAALFAGTLAANLVAAGTVLTALLEVPLRWGILAFGGLTIVYTAVGGFSTVVWTDVIQLVLIVAGVGITLPWFLLQALQPGVLAGLPAGHRDPRSFPAGVLVVYLITGAFAFFGSQDLFQRVYAARTRSAARRGVILFAGLLVVTAVLAVALGILARGLRPGIPPDRALLAATESVVPSGLLGFVLVGFLALANSDADSQLLTVSSNLTQDLLPRLGAGTASETSMVAERLTAVGVGAVALTLAVALPNLTTLFSALGTWFAMLGFVVIASLFCRRMADRAAFAGLTVGFLAPIAFVAVTGAVEPAMLIGLVATGVTVGVSAVLTKGAA
jgi:Na+/proline symporter